MGCIIACLLQIFVQVCGEMNGFVVEGSYPDISQYPHAVYLSGSCDDYGWICGATVLNQWILLTAAHCYINMCTWYNLKAFLGHEDIRLSTIIREVSNGRPHADYDENKLENDICLLILDNSLPLGTNIKRIILPVQFPKNGYEGFVAGWGLTELHKSSKLLKHVYQKLRSKKTCSKVGKLHKGMFCASNTATSYPDAGDSGGALVTLKGYIQIGIVSFKVMEYPNILVYTNVSYYYSWILNNAKRLYCN